MVRDQRGQTLIEVLTAVFVIVVALLGALTLTTATVRNQKVGTDRLIASQLAREGLEVVRSIRDSNWLVDDAVGIPWDTQISGVTNECFVVDTLTSITSTACADVFDPSWQLFYDNSTGVYSEIGAQPSKFYRKVETVPLCLSGGVESRLPAGCGVPDEKIGVEVISSVGWVTEGRSYTVDVVGRLYNWR